MHNTRPNKDKIYEPSYGMSIKGLWRSVAIEVLLLLKALA